MTAPAFIIGGAPRSGTTALARGLDRHPQITMATPFIPEPKVLLVEADPPAAYARLFAGAAPGQVLGEKTSNLFEDLEAPARVTRWLPDTRMVFVLRHPADRAYSNWLWSRLNGLETLSFAEALDREDTRPDPPGMRPGARPFAYLDRSRYGAHAERWIAALGRDRVHFALFEALTAPEAGGPTADLQGFIGVARRDLGPLPTGSGNEAAASGPALGADERSAVSARLAPDIAALARLTDLDLTPWHL